LSELLILASSSPRRVQLLELIGYPFITRPSSIAQENINAPLPRGVELLALEKARDVASELDRGAVLGADTVVELEEEIMGKPADRQEARRMLEKLSGKKHRVCTGLALVKAGEANDFILDHAVTGVSFRPLAKEEIESYLDHEDWGDKAGAYAIQGKAGVFVDKIEGCYFNVVGLPVSKTYQLLCRWGMQPSRYWRKVNGVQQDIY